MEKKDDKWQTSIKSATEEFSGTPIISKFISNMEFNLESDMKSINAVFVIGGTQQTTVNISGQIVNMAVSNVMFQGKYSIKGGENAEGVYTIKYDGTMVDFEVDPYSLHVDLKLGQSIYIVAENNDEEMWSYKCQVEDKSTPSHVKYVGNTNMTLNPNSNFYKTLEENSPFGAFESKITHINIYIDKKNMNSHFHQFKIDLEMTKDGEKVVDIQADTTQTPYSFEMYAPNIFERLNIPDKPIIINVNHAITSIIKIETNLAGGMNFSAMQTQNFGTGGRNIDVLCTKGGVQMWKYNAVTSKIDDDNQLKVGLKTNFELNPKSMIFKYIVSKYEILTPFAKKNSEVEFFWSKKNKNTFMNKFYAKAKIEKDGINVFNLLVSTNEEPYKFFMFCPDILNMYMPGMTKIDFDVDHQVNQHLVMKVNHDDAEFKGFKITHDGNTNEHEIVINDERVKSVFGTWTSKALICNLTLTNGKEITAGIRLDKLFKSPEFFKNNKVQFISAGTGRKLNLDIDWELEQFPDSGHFITNADGQNPRWGKYSVNKGLTWNLTKNEVGINLDGETNFEKGFLADICPIKTEVKLQYDREAKDLVGKITKVMAGKEYSITIPEGQFAMPIIKNGA